MYVYKTQLDGYDKLFLIGILKGIFYINNEFVIFIQNPEA